MLFIGMLCVIDHVFGVVFLYLHLKTVGKCFKGNHVRMTKYMLGPTHVCDMIKQNESEPAGIDF